MKKAIFILAILISALFPMTLNLADSLNISQKAETSLTAWWYNSTHVACKNIFGDVKWLNSKPRLVLQNAVNHLNAMGGGELKILGGVYDSGGATLIDLDGIYNVQIIGVGWNTFLRARTEVIATKSSGGDGCRIAYMKLENYNPYFPVSPGDDALDFDYARNALVEFCEIIGGNSGIAIDRSTVTARNNYIHDNKIGIKCIGDNSLVEGNIIENVEIGLHISRYYSKIVNNQIRNFSLYGIFQDYGKEETVENNNLYSEQPTVKAAMYIAVGYNHYKIHTNTIDIEYGNGIHVLNMLGASITGNTINMYYNNDTAIYIEENVRYSDFSHNIISRCNGTSILFEVGCDNNQALHNIFIVCSNPPIVDDGSNNVIS